MIEAGVDSIAFSLGNYYLYECPPLWITPEIASLIDAVSLFDEKGLMPFPGQWPDQPYWFIEAYKIFRKEQSDWIKSQKPTDGS
jgi:hypothetical protein